MNKSDYSLCLLVSSEPIWFMFILQALKNPVILEKCMIPLRSNVSVSYGFDFYLNLILPESTFPIAIVDCNLRRRPHEFTGRLTRHIPGFNCQKEFANQSVSKEYILEEGIHSFPVDRRRRVH